MLVGAVGPNPPFGATACADISRSTKSEMTSDEDMANRRARLARECAKLDPEEERAIAEEGMAKRIVRACEDLRSVGTTLSK